MNIKKQIQVAMILGLLSLVGGVLGHLALTDIYHAETDVSLEWNILRVCALVFLLFIVYSLMTLRRILKMMQ